MPTYDYICRACGHEFELFQQMSDPVKRTCPKCGKQKLERLIGAGAGVLFKGGGFYETDYRSDGYTKAAEAEKKAAEPKSDAKDSTKSGDSKDSKTAKSETKAAATGDSKSNASSDSAASEGKAGRRSIVAPSRATGAKRRKKK